MSTRQILGAVGFVVGAYFGNPQLGYAIGSAIGGAIDPEVIKGPSIGDIADQTSMEGGPRPFFYALSKPISGNIIAQGPPRIVKKRTSQGKGGPKVETESVYRTYAIGFGEGTATCIRAWRNGQLVWDVSDNSLLTNADNQKFIETARFFDGAFDQLPSPDLEAIFGVGTTPAHRGTCYMVMADEDLTDLRGAIPQWTFQVSRCGVQTAMIVAIASTGADGTHQVMRSIDGETFELQQTPVNVGSPAAGFPWLGIAHSRSLARFVAVNDLTLSLMISFDATDWTLVSGLPGSGWKSVAWSPTLGLFAAVRGDSTQAIMTSSDGENWTLRSTPSFNNAEVIRWVEASALFIAGQVASGSTDCIMTSPDGLVWTKRATPNDSDCHALDSFGLHVRTLSRDLSELQSLDGGQTWTQDTTGVSFGLGDLAYNLSGRCVAVSPFGIAIAQDLGNFNDVADPLTTHWEGVCYSESFGGWYMTNGASAAAGLRVAKIPDGTSDPVPIATPSNCDDGDWIEVIAVDSATAGTCLWTLSAIVEDICARAGLSPELVDAHLLDDIVCRGFTVTNQYPAFAALRALSEIFFFDPGSVDGRVRFIPRGGDSVATITEDDFLDDEEDIEQSRRGDAIAIPRVLHLNYFDIAGGIAPDKQTSERSGDRRALGEMSLQSAVLMSADEAAQVVTIYHKVMIEDQRGELKFQLPDSFIGIVPTDNVVLQWQGRSVRARLAKIDTDDGSQSYVAMHDRQSAYTSNVEGIPAAPQTPPPSSIVGPTLIQPLDIHILRDADDAAGLIYYVAVSGTFDAWQGAQIDLSFDGGANYGDTASTRIASVMGELLTALPDHPSAYADETNTPTVRIDTPSGELEAATFAQLLSGDRNLCIIGDELIQFGGVDETAEGEWQLSTLLRGRKGSTSALHAIGERFVLLDLGSLATIPASLTDIGRTFTFRATSFGTPTDTGTVVSMTYAGRSQIERAPAYLMARREGTDVVLSWQGVGRLGAGISVAHGERFDGYRVTIGDGVLEEQIDTDAEELTHDVTAFGSPLTISVAQVNTITGAGPEIEAVLT